MMINKQRIINDQIREVIKSPQEIIFNIGYNGL